MKKARFFVALLCTVLCFGLLSFAGACKSGEDGKTATLTLSAGEGGTLDKTTYEMEVGASIAELLKGIAPVPEEGLTFAGWYNGQNLLGGETMPAEGYSLTAKYNATYTVELYLEDAEGAYGTPERITGSALYGDAFTYTPAREHYLPDGSRENRLSSEKLGKNETFTAYLKRETYGVHYYVNGPQEGFGGVLFPATVRYGNSLALPDAEGFTHPDWYRFAGWATSADGPLAYRAGETVTPAGEMFLYAVWEEAFYDRFGGGDFLFFPQTEPNVVILLRAGEEHRGSCEGDTFTFENDGKEVFKGKVNRAAGAFVYYREALKDVVYKHADAYRDELHQDGATLTFDGYGSADYTLGGTTTTGEISYDLDSMLYSFTAGDLRFSFLLTDLSVGDESERVFLCPGAEAAAEFYPCFVFYYEEGENRWDVQAYSPLLYSFDGMGTVLVYAISATQDTYALYYIGTYLPTDGGILEIMLLDAEGNVRNVRGKLIEYNGQPVYLEEDGYAGTYSAETGEELTLDGFSGTEQSAVLTAADGTRKEGMYVLESSPLGTYLRFAVTGEKVATYRLDREGKHFELLGGEDYAEYYVYYGASGASPLGNATLILGEDNTALYYPSAQESVSGTVTKTDGKEGFFLFTATDRSVIFEFELFSGFFPSGIYTEYYHYFKRYPTLASSDVESYETEDGATLLVQEDGDGFGDAIYTVGTLSRLGSYMLASDGTFSGIGFDFIEFIDINTGDTFYFKVTGEGKISLFGGESGYYALYDGGTVDRSSFLLLFSDDTPVAYYSTEEGAVTGSYTYSATTEEVVLTHSGGKLSFLLVTAEDGTACFVCHTDLWSGTKTLKSEDGKTLLLDGYGFADYDGIGMQYYLYGRLNEENAYRIYAYATAEEGVYEGYFDLYLGSDTFTVCGYEAGQYYADDTSGDVLFLDGYGKVVRYNIDRRESDGTSLTPLEEGEYVFENTEEEILRVTLGERSFRIHIWGSYDGEDVSLYYTVEFTAAGTYVSDEWEYLSLDSYGEALFTDRYGASYEGSYTKISEHAVSFTASAFDEAQIFVLGEENTFTHPTQGMVVDGDTLVKYLGGSEREVRIPFGVKKIAPLAFSRLVYGALYEGAAIVSVDLNDTEEIGSYAFDGCAFLTTVKGGHVKTVGAFAFYACIELRTLELPVVSEIGELAFHLCESLGKVELAQAKILYSSAFSGCSGLVTVVLPAAEKLYEGVFYDCHALRSVTLGEHLVQLGTPEESVAGVFARSSAPAQSSLKVTLLGSTVPAVGADLFEGVETYTVVVPDISAVKQFYLSDGWGAYDRNLGCESGFDGTYYRYSFSVSAIVLNGVMRRVYGSLDLHGAYEVRNNILYLLQYDASAEGHYREKAIGVFTEDGALLYNAWGYEMVEENYKDFDRYVKAGKEVTINLTYPEDAGTLVFTPAEYTSFAVGAVYEVPGVWTKSGTPKEVTVCLSYDSYFSSTLYFLSEGDRYGISSVSSSGDSLTASLDEPVFNPVVRAYAADDTSLFVLSQNDREGTEYTASFVLAGIVDDDGRAINVKQAPVTKNADGTFTTVDSHVYAGYSYRITFTITGEESFTYSFVRERRIVIDAEDGSAQVILSQSAAGEVTSATLYVSGREIGNDMENKVYTQEGNVYHWLVYEYNYAGEFTLTLTGEGENLTGTLTCGTVVKGFLDGVYVIAFFRGETRTALYMRGADYVYGKVEDSSVTEEEGYYTVTFGGNKYYVTFDLGSKSLTIVFADRTYQSADWDDVKGTVRMERDPDGSIKSMTLTVDGKAYTNYTEHGEEYDKYYIFAEGGTFYYVTFGSSSCSIYPLEEKTYTHTATNFVITLLIRENGTIVSVVSATFGGEDAMEKVVYESRTIGGEDYLLIVLTTEEGEKRYLATSATTAIDLLTEQVVASADGKYRVTVTVTESGIIYKATKFEIDSGTGLEEVPIDWCGSAHSEDDDRNYEIDVGSDFYYFNISKQGGEWTLTLVKILQN